MSNFTRHDRSHYLFWNFTDDQNKSPLVYKHFDKHLTKYTNSKFAVEVLEQTFGEDYYKDLRLKELLGCITELNKNLDIHNRCYNYSLNIVAGKHSKIEISNSDQITTIKAKVKSKVLTFGHPVDLPTLHTALIVYEKCLIEMKKPFCSKEIKDLKSRIDEQLKLMVDGKIDKIEMDYAPITNKVYNQLFDLAEFEALKNDLLRFDIIPEKSENIKYHRHYVEKFKELAGDNYLIKTEMPEESIEK